MAVLALPATQSRLQNAVDALVDSSIDALTTDALGENIIDIRLAIDRLEAESIRRVHRFHQQGGALSDGGGTTVCWLRRCCRMTAKAAAYSVHLARTLGEMPATLDSARAGRSSFTNVAMIGHLAGQVGVEQLRPYEDFLVEAAEQVTPRQMRYATQTTRIGIDPDGVLADANHDHESRWLDCDETYGGVFVVRGQFDAEGGALLKTAIDSLSHGLTRGEERSASQRRADALVDMAATQLRCGDSRDVHGQRPHLTLIVSAETLRADRVGTHTLRSAGLAASAELRGVGPIHPETARRIACDAVRTEVTVAPTADGPVWTNLFARPVPLSVGRATRTIPAPIRTALNLRDEGCRFPGCDRPSGWTDGHHIVHWSDGGPTELGNLVSLCRQHHRRVHEEGWRIHIADGSAVVEPPPWRTPGD
jgi:uncharacterized protein DUF222/HNH endonuclease